MRRTAPELVRLTSAADRHDHYVRETAYAHAMSERTGECVAVCGHAVIMTALASPPGPPCPRCADAVGDGTGRPRP